MIRRIAILSLLLTGGVSPGEKAPVLPVIPEAIAVPEGYVVVATFPAKGDQLYEARVGKGGRLEWAFVAPKAVLYDARGKKAGTHYAGPTWEAEDGSKISREKTMDLKSAPSGDAEADIPSLRLEVKAKGKAGVLSKVVYVQRLKSRGGVAPKAGPKNAESKVAVPYTATYVFYAKKE